jgi:hypothetical protein
MPRYDIGAMETELQGLKQRDADSYNRIMNAARAANAASDRQQGAQTGTFTLAKPDTADVTRRLKLKAQADAAIRLIDAMNFLWKNRIEPKLKTGEITSTDQGLRYVYPTTKGRPDPDVDRWLKMAGQLGFELNAYYSGQSGGRGGISQYQAVKQHVPYPPSSMRDITGGLGYFGESGEHGARQWNLNEMGDWPADLKRQIMISQGEMAPSGAGGPTTAPPPSSTSKDPYGLEKHGLKP